MAKLKIHIRPSKLFGKLALPSSKSQTIRALIFGSLCEGISLIKNPLNSLDTLTAQLACQSIGAKIEKKDSVLEIKGVKGEIHGASDVIQSGNSGLVLRFMGAIGALSPLPFVITGDSSIRMQRPILPLLEGLKQWRAAAFSLRENNLAPFFVKGPLKEGTALIDGSDSQPVSALLIAAAFSNGNFKLCVKNPGEKAWVALTLSWLKKLGVDVSNNCFEEFIISGNKKRPSFETKIAGDLSACAFPVVTSLVTKSSVLIENVDFADAQGDKNFFYELMDAGVHLEINETEKTLFVPKQPCQFRGGIFDVNNWIDAIPILSVLACFGENETRIINASIAKKKESNRLLSMAQELKKMGGKIEETEDGLIISPQKLKGAHLFSHHDHRVAMALCVAACAADSESKLEEAQCIAKSYPDFIVHLQKLGAKIVCD